MALKLCPFRLDDVKQEGVKNLRDFHRKWLPKYGRSWWTGLNHLKEGDVVLLAWVIEEGRWAVVGHATVTKVEYDPEAEKKFHIRTKSLCIFESSHEVKGRPLTEFEL